MAGRSDLRTIVPALEKTILVLVPLLRLFAQSMALRSDPLPLFLRLETTSVASARGIGLFAARWAMGAFEGVPDTGVAAALAGAARRVNDAAHAAALTTPTLAVSLCSTRCPLGSSPYALPAP